MANKPIHILRYGTVAEKVHLEKAISVCGDIPIIKKWCVLY